MSHIPQEFISAVEHEVESNTARKGPWENWKPTISQALREFLWHVKKLESAVKSNDLPHILEYAADCGAIVSKCWSSTKEKIMQDMRIYQVDSGGTTEFWCGTSEDLVKNTYLSGFDSDDEISKDTELSEVPLDKASFIMIRNGEAGSSRISLLTIYNDTLKGMQARNDFSPTCLASTEV